MQYFEYKVSTKVKNTRMKTTVSIENSSYLMPNSQKILSQAVFSQTVIELLLPVLLSPGQILVDRSH